MAGRRLALLTVGMAVVAAGCGGGGHKVRSLAASTPTTAADTTTVADADTSQAGSDYGRYGQPAATTATTASPATTKAPSKTASPAPAAAGSNSSNPQPSPSSTQAPATTQPPSTTTTRPPDILIQNFTFQPPALHVAVGATVTVKNTDGVTHTWTDDSGGFDSGNLNQNQSFSHTYSAAGTFTYHCNIHRSMTGTVTAG
jgi:plastocyanin